MAGNWSGYGFDPDSYQKGAGRTSGGGGGLTDIYNRSRFFTVVGNEKIVIFLHDLRSCMQIVEHEIWNPDEGSYGKPYHLPCRKYNEKSMDKRCLPCEKNSKPGRALVMSVIDVNGFTMRKAGEPEKEFRNLKRLFIIPYPMIDLFVRKEKDAGGSLKLKKFKIFRSRKQTSRLGDDFTFIGPVSEDELKSQNVDFAPYDYSKIIPVETTYENQLEFDSAYPSAIYEKKKKEKDGATPAASSPSPAKANTPSPAAAPSSPPPASDDNIPYNNEAEEAPQTYPPF